MFKGLQDIFGWDADKDKLIDKLHQDLKFERDRRTHDWQELVEGRDKEIRLRDQETMKYFKHTTSLKDSISEQTYEHNTAMNQVRGQLDVANELIKLQEKELTDCMHKLINAQHKLLEE